MRYGTCFLCGKTGWLEEHHVYPGPFRDKSEKYGLKVGLCGESCHRNGRYAAHQCRETSDALKQFWQIKYMMAHKASVADFRAAFGKNYLELDYYDDERSYPIHAMIKATESLFDDLHFDESQEWVQLPNLFGSPAIPKEAADTITQALDKMVKEGEIGQKNKWQALEYWAADYLAGK